MPDNEKQLSLEDAAKHLLEECRMVLPGVQALFGFQLVAIFNQRFAEAVSANEQRLHLAAILCVVVSVALVMTPAALHRQREPMSVSRRFIDVSSRLLMWSMVPLAVATALDLYIIARIILGNQPVAAVVAAAALAVFIILWKVWPARVRLV
ncbi:MAG: hypothetical protein JWM41_4788 [Gemmatimonadetes bacterium]|nr:hypothetical protein [Gemmatimonadota bacterium]